MLFTLKYNFLCLCLNNILLFSEKTMEENSESFAKIKSSKSKKMNYMNAMFVAENLIHYAKSKIIEKYIRVRNQLNVVNVGNILLILGP